MSATSAGSKGGGDATDGCGAQAIRHHLTLILASPAFVASPQLRAFLSYVVERRLDGEPDRIKGYTIATEALGRPSSFDPSADPIVRVEAARLRRLLSDYYGSEGANAPLRIDIPKGGYVPRFSRQAGAAASGEAASGEAVEAKPTRPRIRNLRMAGAVAAVVVIALAVPLVYQPAPVDRSAPPSAEMAVARIAEPGMAKPAGYKGTLPAVHVAAITEDPATALPAGFSSLALHDKLARALARFDEIGVSERPEAADYRLEGHIAVDQGRLFLNFRLLYQASGEVVWSSLFDVASDGEPADLLEERVARNAATAIAQPYGVIFNHAAANAGGTNEAGAAPGEEPSGFACVLRTFTAQRRFTPDMNARSRACLASLAARTQAPAAVHALLPLAYVDDARSGRDPGRRSADLDKALELARRAVALSPQSGRAHQALEAVLLLLGRHAEALEAGRRALELNPNDPDIIATHGGALVMSGDSEKGLTLLVHAGRLSPDHPEWYTVMTVFGALGTGRMALAQAEAESLDGSTALSALLARLLVAHKAGDTTASRTVLTALETEFPSFADDPEAILRSALPSPALQASLLAAVREAQDRRR